MKPRRTWAQRHCRAIGDGLHIAAGISAGNLFALSGHSWLWWVGTVLWIGFLLYVADGLIDSAIDDAHDEGYRKGHAYRGVFGP